MERPDRGITVGTLADTHDDRYSKPRHGTGRRIAGDVWRALQALEPNSEVTAYAPDPGTVEVIVRLDALWVGPFRWRRVKRIADPAARAAVAVGYTVRVRVIASWQDA